MRCGLLIGVTLLSVWCCETVHGETIRVRKGAIGTGDGTSWADACDELSSGIARASAGDQVWVAAGTYSPIVLKEGVAVLGGFTGSETDVAQRNPRTSRAIVSGGGVRQCIHSIGHTKATVVDGLHIEDGRANGFLEAGGGAYLKESGAAFVNCRFTRNSAEFAGGAIANYGGSPTFVDCVFTENGGDGHTNPPYGGGAVFNHDGSPTFFNCVFLRNVAAEGGAVATVEGAPRLLNCTFTANRATVQYGGAIFDNPGSSVIRNSILWDNVATVPSTSQIFNSPFFARAQAAYSDIQGGWLGVGNLDTDPLFVSANDGDVRLQSASPCRAAGQASSNTDVLPESITLQPDEAPVDIGAIDPAP